VWTEYGEQWGQRCWIYPGGHGNISFEEAINQSCDIYFYSVAAAFYEHWEETPTEQRKDEFQDYLRSWGFGSATGVELPGEAYGRVPTQLWKKEYFSDTPEAALWNPGDMTNMVIGQGDILVTPLQIVNGYTGIARRELLVPHVMLKVLDADGNTVLEHKPQPVSPQPAFSDYTVARLEDGLTRVVNRMGNFDMIPVSVAGKSGTAEVAGKDDYSWFVAYAPIEDPQYCVACVVEQAGDGSSAAVVACVHAMAAIYDVDAGTIEVTKSVAER
jgi:penicillin-binding protein 2